MITYDCPACGESHTIDGEINTATAERYHSATLAAEALVGAVCGTILYRNGIRFRLATEGDYANTTPEARIAIRTFLAAHPDDRRDREYMHGAILAALEEAR